MKLSQRIYEAYGFHDLDNEAYFRKCYHIAGEVLNLFRNPRNRNYELIVSKPLSPESSQPVVVKDNMSLFEYNIDLSWLKTLNIYISYSDKDCMVVDNTVSYRYVTNPSGTALLKPVLTKVEYMFRNQTTEIFPLLKSNDMIISGSIVVSMIDDLTTPDNTYTQKELAYVLMHEIGHLYDVYTTKSNFLYINRDLVNIDSTDLQYERTTRTASDYNRFVQKYKNAVILNDMNISLSVKKNIIENKLDVETLHIMFGKNVYKINKSELRQRIKNFLYDMSLLCNDDIKRIGSDSAKRKYSLNNAASDSKELYICEKSETYRFYHSLAQMFRLLIRYVDDRLKSQFAEEVIVPVYEDDFFMDDDPDSEYMLTNPRAYDMVFLKKSEQDRKSLVKKFDNFFEYHIKNIDRVFLRNCCAIVENMQQKLIRYKFICENFHLFIHNNENVSQKLRYMRIL